MKAIALIGLVLLVSGCGKGVGFADFQVDPEFTAQVAEFNRYAEQYGAPQAQVTIQFGDTEGMLAKCLRPAIGARHILVDRYYWEKGYPMDRRVVMLHELGHCVLNREHVDSVKSLMNPKPTLIAGNFLGGPKPFIEELFSH